MNICNEILNDKIDEKRQKISNKNIIDFERKITLEIKTIAYSLVLFCIILADPQNKPCFSESQRDQCSIKDDDSIYD